MYPGRKIVIGVVASVAFPMLIPAQAAKTSLSICGKEIRIGSLQNSVDALFSDPQGSCKVERLDAGLYAIVPQSLENERKEGPLGNVRFENGRVSELDREINLDDEDAQATAFIVFHLLQDFERSANVSCTIGSFQNRGDWMVSNGTTLDCGNRTLKLVSIEFNDGKRVIDVSEVLRK
jgi:hypothetical protein